ncbi:hypothetical protein H5410_016323 [Solanum commersonii]|uniref:Uncharacterized protein n=1 Tax=Solanum commersonii TaxID=4109 RepID=A0A9J5ZWP4_SOLCO|nr:hypothetical protein H5410_016323 [Solanum commersonii]
MLPALVALTEHPEHSLLRLEVVYLGYDLEKSICLITSCDPSISDFRSRMEKIEATTVDPLARSEVMLPASAITFPVLTNIKKVLKTSAADISPALTNLPPYQKSRAQQMNVRPCADPIPIPASQDFFLASFLGSSCASSKISRTLCMLPNDVTIL